MGWWESFALTVTSLTVFALLRSKRSVRAALNSQHYSLSSQPTEARPTLFDPDQVETDRTFHVSWCNHCNQKAAVPLARTALERRPWRVVWKCEACENMTAAAVPPQMVNDFLELDRAGGMRLSIREAKQFTMATVQELNRAIRTEL